MRFIRRYKLINGKIMGFRIFPNTRWATPIRLMETNMWKNIYRFLLGKNK